MLKNRIQLLVLALSVIKLLGCSGSSGQEAHGEDASHESGGQVIKVPQDGLSLNEAIETAREGSEIHISADIYAGGLYVTDTDISIIGIGGVAVIDCTERDESGITSRDSRLTIENIQIVNCDDGISTDSYLAVKHSSFIGNVDGIDAEDGSSGAIENSYFTLNRDDGIDLDDNSEFVIQSNSILNNGDDGIEIRTQNFAEQKELFILIKENYVALNGQAGVQIIDYENSERKRVFVVERNDFVGNVLTNLSIMDNEQTAEDLKPGTSIEGVIVANNLFFGGQICTSLQQNENTRFENNILLGCTIQDDASIPISETNAALSSTSDYWIESTFVVKDVRRLIEENEEFVDAGLSDLSIQGFTYQLEYNGVAPDIGPIELDR